MHQVLYDSFHCLNTDANRDLFVRYYASVALFAYYYWVLAGVDILRKDANLFAKQRGNKTRKALMRERVWSVEQTVTGTSRTPERCASMPSPALARNSR